MNIPTFLMLGISLLKEISSVNVPQWKPTYHLGPEKGWMSDPNGLIYFDEYYHAFYQHILNIDMTGSMHWGHAKSKDMLNWEYLPIALAPSLPEDNYGVFSGSAVSKNGNLTLIYTGSSDNNTHQMQCLATSSDGIIFEKEGVVLQKDGDDKDFRDPKAWRQDDAWFVILGSKTTDNKAQVLLYISYDLHTWESQGIFAQADDKLGYMWECPDLFTLGDKQILVVNPQGIIQDGYDYQNFDQTGYFVGTWTPGSIYKIERGFREIDHGHDFYATQTFIAPDDRRIQIAWLGMWESSFPEKAYGWSGMFTLPRELTLSSSGDLEVRPIREIRERRKNPIIKNSLFALNSPLTLEFNVLRKEISIDFDLPLSTAEIFGVRMGGDSTDAAVKLYVNATEGRLFLERYYPQYNIEASTRSVPIILNKTLNLDIFVDGSSIEVFVNDGQAVLSSRIYPNDDERDLSLFFGSGRINCSLTSWDL